MDREKVVKEFEHLLNAANGNYQDFVDLTVDVGKEILALLKEQPEIVMCKDCKYWGTNDCSMYNQYGEDEPTPDEWFCCIGERQ